MLFGIKSLREAVEGTKCVITKEKFDKQLAGLSSAPYVSVKTHPSEKHKSVMFHEYKLLMTEGIQDLRVDRIRKIDLTGLVSIEAEVIGIILAMTEAMVDGDAISDCSIMIL